MSCNCGLNEIFTDKVSARDARKFRRRGLDVRARRMLRALESRVELRDRTTLEVGIGTGGFTIEMLRRGTRASIGVDALGNQLQQAQGLATEAGVAERLTLKQGDFTEIESQVGEVDVVVLDRVVCCYPDWHSLLSAVGSHARKAIVMSYPRESWYTRIWIASANAGMRALRRSFRLYLHSPTAMHELLRSRGFHTEVIGHRLPWELLVATRGGSR
jgi:2-polyprenyl-3-methyl-5-hydroxy-6-metoxy-1,4-benzoquinol methylase